MVSGQQSQEYEIRLKELGQADMLQTFKIVEKFDNVDSEQLFTFVDTTTRITRQTGR